MKLASIKDCTGCMGCVNACSHGVLDYSFDKHGYFRIDIAHPEKCVECGLCTKACPVVSPKAVTNDSHKCYAAWDKDSDQRAASASGGVFAALAAKILEEGSVVYGAAIEGFEVKHKRIDLIEDLHELQGTKYQLSICNVYSDVRKQLLAGRKVLFSGMGCQVNALYNYLGRVSTERLLTIDTICGGYSSILPMEELKKSGKFSGIYSFRDKSDGWKSKGFKYCLKMKGKNGEVCSLGADNMVTRTFCTHLFKQSACLKCKFNGVDRNSDLTIGDFWGLERYADEHSRGVSCIVAHSEKGEKALAESGITLHESALEEIARNNANLYWSQYGYLRHSLSRKLALWCLATGKNNLALRLSAYSGLLSIGWRLYMRFNDRKRERYLKNILANR